MKNFKVKWLLLSIILSIASIPQMWGNLYIIGTMNNWNADNWSSDWELTDPDGDGTYELLVELEGSTNYQIKLRDGYDDRSCDATITNSVSNYNLNLQGSDAATIKLNTSDAGVYIFKYKYANSKHNLSVSFPKDRLYKQKYIYFDASNSSYWTGANFHTKFVFSYYDSGSWIEDKFWDDKFDGWVYCTPVPNNNYVGKVQLIRLDPSSNHGSQWNTSGTANASSRSSLGDNCLYVDPDNANWKDTWVPLWKTYCPPMYTASLSDNSTSKISWQSGSGTSGDPYLVPASGTIKVSASATSKVEEDENMTKKYDFKVNTGSGASSAQDGTGSTFDKTSLVNNTTYEISVEPYNYYNSTSGAKYTSATHIWYKALTMYSATHTMTNVTKSAGRDGSNAAAYKLAYSATYAAATGYNLPSTITVKFGSTTKTAGTDYTWNQSTGVLSIPVNKVDGNITIIISGVAKTYTEADNLDKNGGDSHGKYTATFDATTIAINTTPTKTGYHVDGYYGESGKTTYIADASGNLQASKTVSGNQVTDANKKWKRNANITLFTKWTPNAYSVRFNSNYPAGAPNNGATMSNQSFTYDAAQNLTTNAFACEGYTFAGWATSEDGSVAHTDGKSVSNLTTAKDGTVDLYAKWTDNNEYYFKGATSTDWNTASNWTKGAVPNDEDHKVYIFAPVKISSGTVHVKSVDIITAGSYSPSVGSTVTAASSKLTIGAGAMLIVKDKVQNYDRSTSKADSTRASTLHIESGATGNGALVWGETNSTPGYAQVDFYTKSHGEKDQNSSINQYIGTPFSNEQSILYQYYYSWLFKIKRTAGVLDWDLMRGDESMNEFEGYNLITAYDKGTVYQMEGILVSNKDVTLNSTSSTPRLVNVDATGADNPNNENVLANSWVAPIKIKNMSGAFGDDIEASIHIFNAGSPNDTESGGTAGNYTPYSVGEADDDDVIPSMQSFSVYTKGASPVLTLDYSALVYDDADDDLIKPNFAPRRSASIRETQDALKIRIEGENGWADELKIFIHDEFSNAFENGWDAHKMYGYPEAPQLYAVTTDGNMAINCVPTADNNVLGFTPGSEDNEYTFSFTYDGDEEYYLKDTKLNIETLINTEATYTFTSEAEDSDMRFIIIKRAPAVATDAETVSGDRLAVCGVQKIMHNGQLYIIRDGGIYSTDGQMVK